MKPEWVKAERMKSKRVKQSVRELDQANSMYLFQK